LVPIDFSGISDRVISDARLLAGALNAKMWLLYVAEPEPDFVGFKAGPKAVRNQVARVYREEHKKIQSHATSLRETGIDTEALLVQGGIVDCIVEQAIRLEVSVIVMGSHGHTALERVVLGSVTEGVLKHAPCAVHIVPSHIADAG